VKLRIARLKNCTIVDRWLECKTQKSPSARRFCIPRFVRFARKLLAAISLRIALAAEISFVGAKSFHFARPCGENDRKTRRFRDELCAELGEFCTNRHPHLAR